MTLLYCALKKATADIVSKYIFNLLSILLNAFNVYTIYNDQQKITGSAAGALFKIGHVEIGEIPSPDMKKQP